MPDNVFIAIDLKSFFASVECVERGLDPLTALLVVADETRTDKTICLAVSPALKAYGVPGRARLFEAVQRVREVNADRRRLAPGRVFRGKSCHDPDLRADPSLEMDFIRAKPQMGHYMKVSTQIYQIYLKYVAPEDIHVYSVDEVFIDATAYLKTYGKTPREFTMMLIRDVLKTTGITATAGIGSNLYLCKIAMDIEAKHIPADAQGVRIAELDERTYREKLWDHKPLTDFWRVGRGHADKLRRYGMNTMGDVARMSLVNEECLYRLFGVEAELLIDHAWGWESCTMAAIKAYRPDTNSLSNGQVLPVPYTCGKGRLIVLEMTDALVLQLVDKHLVTDKMTLTVCYDTENLTDPDRRRSYHGPVTEDYYGRQVPKEAHGSIRLDAPTSSTKLIMEATGQLYDRIVDKNLLVRRMYVVAENVTEESKTAAPDTGEQMDMFTDYSALDARREEEKARLEREKRRQQAILDIKKKYGRNAIVRGMNLEEGATGMERNGMVGGHKT